MALQKSKESTSLNRAINNLQGKLKNTFLNSYTHNIVPGYNLHINPSVDNYDEDNLMRLFQQFPYDSNLPRPLLPPARLPQCVLKNDDPALQLLSAKSEIKDNMNRILEYHEKNRRDLTVCAKKRIKWKANDENVMQTSIPRYIARLAEIMEYDPDPEFQGEYNWYYTGGSLDHLNLSGQNILLFPYAKELVAVPINEISNSLWKPNLKIAAKFDLSNTLYEVRHAITSNNTCRILGRQKHSCHLYSLSEIRGKYKLDEISKKASNIPYISANLSSIDANKYCLAKSNRLVKFYDLNKNRKCVSRTLIPRGSNLPDNWMNVQFHPSDRNLIIIVDRCCLYHIDSRTPSNEPDLTLCLKNNLETCESLSLCTASKHNPFYHYLGAYHSLLLCDSRFQKSCAVQKWTHQFKSPPLFCAIADRNDEEIITLSSQLAGENSVIVNTWTSENRMHSYSLPHMPLSMSETLRACQDQGKCLDPSMRSRLDLCNAGTTLNMNDSDGVTFFTQNSIGDIFYQCITHKKKLSKTSKINMKSLSALDAWEMACLNQSITMKPLVVSAKTNMKHILDAMKYVNSDVENIELDEEEFQPRWFQSIEQLSSYVDILAPELLSIWDVKENTIPLTVTPHQKVLSWLEKKTSSENLSQSQSLIKSQEDSSVYNGTNEILSQELISVSQSMIDNYTPNNTTTEQMVYDVPASERTRKKDAKKRKYISGF